ncbi:MAG: sulfite exporter TauE/SafE family protein, partial [Fimbriimonadia bacterium]
GVGAGAFGAILGLGGGIIMVPVLTQALSVPMDKAVAASLLGIIATSAASSVEYLSQKRTDLDLASRLLLSSVVGAVAGTFVGKPLFGSEEGRRVTAGLFAAVTLIVAWLMFRNRQQETDDDRQTKHVVPPRAHVAVFGGGVLSTLLGIGGGAINVPTIALAVGAPMKVAAATSSYMIGVTAASGVAIYAWAGMVDPTIAGPSALGLLVGAQLGARTAKFVSGKNLRALFSLVLLYMAYMMARRAILG